jgi:4-diphosphocytidyl-2-C-methyl-D-erythritol kinase
MPADTLTSVSVRVPAKVNLDLSVGALQADGFHPISTVFHAISLFDDVTVTATDADVSVRITGDHVDGVPADGTNLAARAARLLAERAGVETGVQILLHKGIPVAAGLAGGSADAAATLVACDALWRTNLARAEMAELAAELGSDVAFALVGGTAIGTGRGEQITPALARGSYHWVLALDPEGLSTPAVYAEHDRLVALYAVPEPRVSDAVMQALRGGDGVALGRALRNDLQAAACSLRPALAELLAAGEDLGALGGVVSGSGPTVAFLVRDTEHAMDLSISLTASGAAGVIKRAHGPVPGARVVDLPRLT